uniref:Uncharacterized protein n=1 Tax=Opuntia streptacantha TaxID=393608 RepID=A0A7C9AT47_OPUST
MGSPVSTQLILPSPYAFSLLSPPRLSNPRFLQYPIHHQIPTFNCNTPPKMTFTSTRVPPNRCFSGTNPNFGRSLIVKSQLKFNSPLISSDDHWGIWTSLFGIGAFGLCGNGDWDSGCIFDSTRAIPWS